MNMKIFVNKIKYSLLGVIAFFGVSGCNFLDVDPELGLSDEEVFGSYSAFRKYFDWIYESNGGKNMERIHIAYPFYYDLFQQYAFSWYNTTDISDAGRMGVSQQYFKQGALTQDFLEKVTFDTGKADNKPIAKAMFSTIRRCNMTIAHIDECLNITEEQKNDLLGQAYALRGFAHFTLCRLFGGMPYLDHVIEADEEWDLPRLSTHETFTKAAEDLKTGYEMMVAAGVARRNTPENLVSGTVDEINGIAAIGIRSRVLLYAASELHNERGAEDWVVAAEAAAEALKAALDAGFTLLSKEKYTNNFYGQQMTNETIWAWSYKAKNNHKNFEGIFAYPQSGLAGNATSGVCPTQNFVDRYETVYGEPLVTEEDKAAAIAAGHYNPQNPYVGRDPRLELTIVHDGSANSYASKKVINIYYDPAKKTYPVTSISKVNVNFAIDWGTKDNSVQGYSNTGYYCQKYWDGNIGTKGKSHYHIDPIVRVAELYLNYAEAVNEAYGPNGTAGGLDLTAVQAVNIIRNRIGQPDVLEKFTADKNAFRERIRNERGIELAFEGHHYYYDIRRWKIAPELMGKTLYGMYVESIKKSDEYPIGRKFEVRPLPNNRQCVWKDYMYYLPFPDSEAYKLKNFVNWTWK